MPYWLTCLSISRLLLRSRVPVAWYLSDAIVRAETDQQPHAGIAQDQAEPCEVQRHRKIDSCDDQRGARLRVIGEERGS